MELNAALNWFVTGYRLILETGFEPSQRVMQAVAEYRQEADVIGLFLFECTAESEKGSISTPDLYLRYTAWTKDNGYKPMNSRNFVGELRRRCDVRKRSHSNVVVGRVVHGSGQCYFFCAGKKKTGGEDKSFSLPAISCLFGNSCPVTSCTWYARLQPLMRRLAIAWVIPAGTVAMRTLCCAPAA